MVESEAKELPEAVMLDAVLFGHEQMQPVIQVIRELAAEIGTPAREWQAPEKDAAAGRGKLPKYRLHRWVRLTPLRTKWCGKPRCVQRVAQSLKR